LPRTWPAMVLSSSRMNLHQPATTARAEAAEMSLAEPVPP
jgi:hypothetical protein